VYGTEDIGIYLIWLVRLSAKASFAMCFTPMLSTASKAGGLLPLDDQYFRTFGML
jgi:hypothetical protein